MTTTTNITGLLNTLVDDLENWNIYLILADALEEAGESSAADCCRWMSAKQKRPSKYIHCYDIYWWHMHHMAYMPLNDWLPQTLFDALSTGPAHIQPTYTNRVKRFLSAQDAIQTIWDAWGRLTDTERQACWDWDGEKP